MDKYCSLLRSKRIRFFRRTSRCNSLCINVNSSTACLRCGRHGPVFPRRRQLFVIGGVGTMGSTCVGRKDKIVSFLPALSLMGPSIFIMGTRNNSSRGQGVYTRQNVRCIRLRHAPRRNLGTHSSSSLGGTLSATSSGAARGTNVPAHLSLTKA